MANSNDLVLDDVRWGISAALSFAAGATAPTSAAKDAGAVAGQAIDPDIENRRWGMTYIALLLILTEILPELMPWDGVAPTSPPPTVVADGADGLTVAGGSGGSVRYWLGGQLVSVANGTVGYTIDGSEPRSDYLVVEVAADGTGTYTTVDGSGSTLPTLAANQYAIASFNVPSGPASDTATDIVLVVYEPTFKPPERSQTLTIPGTSFCVQDQANTSAHLFSSGYLQPNGGSISYILVAEVNLPDGAVVQAIQLTFRNTGTSVNVEASARRLNVRTGNATVEWASIASTAVSTAPQLLDFVGVDSEVIDNSEQAYLIEVRFTSAATNPEDLSFVGAIIDYDMPEAA